MYSPIDSRAADHLGLAYDYLHVETGTEAKGLDSLSVGKRIRYHISDLVRNVLREEQRL